MKLYLNVSQTKEMIINFSRRTLALQPVVINAFDNRLKFDQNSDAIIKKSHQRLFVLRKLNSFNVQRVGLRFYNFYDFTIRFVEQI